jgi:hypothetical protein
MGIALKLFSALALAGLLAPCTSSSLCWLVKKMHHAMLFVPKAQSPQIVDILGTDQLSKMLRGLWLHFWLWCIQPSVLVLIAGSSASLACMMASRSE